MDLLQLQYFIAIAECQHITKAAQSLRVSQPSLSNTLSRIENELGAKLFDRQGRNIVLNDYGKIVLAHAKTIFRELDNITTELDALREHQSRRIRIGSVDSTYVKDWLPSFLETYPDIVVHHTIDSCATLEAQLLAGDIDFAITDARTLPEECASHILGTDEYVVLTPLDSTIASDAPMDFASFRTPPSFARQKPKTSCAPSTSSAKKPISSPTSSSKAARNSSAVCKISATATSSPTSPASIGPNTSPSAKNIRASSPSPTNAPAITSISSGTHAAPSPAPPKPSSTTPATTPTSSTASPKATTSTPTSRSSCPCKHTA